MIILDRDCSISEWFDVFVKLTDKLSGDDYHEPMLEELIKLRDSGEVLDLEEKEALDELIKYLDDRR